MSAMQTTSASPVPLAPAGDRVAIGLLRALLLAEAALGLGLTIFLSLLASALRDFLGGDSGVQAEQTVRFVAGFSLIFAILAAVTSRGARRRRGWSWTLAALLQLALAIGTGIAVIVATWHPAYLIGFALAATVMLVLSSGAVRRVLGQE